MKSNALLLVVIALVPLSGCNPSGNISQIRLNDPGAKISANIVVNRDGTFHEEVEQGEVIAILDGNLRSLGDEQYEVTVNYERKTYTSASTFTSEKIACQLMTIAGAAVPIGKNPDGSGSSSENTGDDASLDGLTIELVSPSDH
ncbi:MAG: hypothetical protein MK108_15500 [Mariniblastus sp.]|nr:hypothetical protein [Mariniblastus sp.]